MIRIKNKKILAYILAGIVVLQAGVVGYSMVSKGVLGSLADSESQSTANSDNSSATQKSAQTINTSIIQDNNEVTDTEISQEILDLIKQSDPSGYEKNVANYKELLVKLDVHSSFKDEIERLIKEGHNIKDILTAYYFLFDKYGSKSELEQMIKDKESNKTWTDILKDYDAQNPEFVPRNFDSDYLAKLMKTQGISKDDIMIADRVSGKTLISIDELITMKATTPKWKVINASLDLMNSQQNLPYVPVTTAEVNKYLSGNMTEEKVVQALVLASKLNASPSDVAGYMNDGLPKEEIYAKCLEAKYY